MTARRPCLRCRADAAPLDETCPRCGAPLVARAAGRGGGETAAAARPSRRRLVLGTVALGLALVGVIAAIVLGQRSEPASLGPSWSEPATIAAWTAAELARRGQAGVSVRAVLETRTTRPRRVVVTEHPADASARGAVAAMADLLVAAARRGETRAIDVAVLRLGSSDDVVALALGEALRVRESEAEIDRLLAGGARLPVREDAGQPPAVVEVAPPDLPEADGDEPVSKVASARDPAPRGAGASAAGGVSSASGEPRGRRPATEDDAEGGDGDDGEDGEPPVRPVRVHFGPGPAISHRAQPGETDVVLHRIAIHPAARRALILRELTLAARGTLDDTLDVEFIGLVQDVDRDGRRSGGDLLVGEPDAFVDDDGSVTWADLDVPFGSDGTPLHLLTVVDFTVGTEGGTIALTVPGDGLRVEEVASERFAPAVGLPLRGRSVTLEADVEPDLEQDRLDRLAAQGPDASDDRLKR